MTLSPGGALFVLSWRWGFRIIPKPHLGLRLALIVAYCGGSYQDPLTTLYQGLGAHDYLEGHWDLVRRLITPISHIVTPIILIINLLTKSP